jgi:hypothetical protein
VLLPPLATDVGEADSETVGAGVGDGSAGSLETATVTFACFDPPAPVHVST